MGDTLGTGQIITALAGFGGVIVGSLISWGVQVSLLGRRIAADRDIAKDKFDFDKQLAERKFSDDRDLAERKFAQERVQLVYKRQFELAEGLLSDAYRFRDLIRAARISGSFGGEGTTRKSEKDESAQVKQMKDTYYIPAERLQRNGEFFAGFFAKQFTATAQFGPKVRESFDLLTEATNGIYIASGMLITMVDQPSLNDQKVHDELLDILWAGRAQALHREDKTAAQIERAVTTLEAVCRPVLEKAVS
jgi:hypothetical protein